MGVTLINLEKTDHTFHSLILNYNHFILPGGMNSVADSDDVSCTANIQIGTGEGDEARVSHSMLIPVRYTQRVTHDNHVPLCSKRVMTGANWNNQRKQQLFL